MVSDSVVLAIFLAIPVACFVLSVVAFSLAADPPAQAPRNRVRTGKLFAASLIPALFVLISHVVAPNSESSERMFDSDLQGVTYLLIELLMVATPVILAATWFRRIAPTRAIYVLMTIVAISAGVFLALADLTLRALSGI